MRRPKAIDLLWGISFLFVLALAIGLRFHGLQEPSLWLDEITHVERAREALDVSMGGSWHSWLTGLPMDRENGPLYYALQLLSLSVFDGEFAVRLMPALAGVGAILALMGVAIKVTEDRWVGLVAGLLIAVSPLHVYYSREGRPYAAVMLAAALLLFLALNFRRRWARWLVYPTGIATAYLGAIAGPLLAAFFGIACLTWWIYRREDPSRGRGHLILAAGASLAILPMLFPTVQGIDRFSGETVERKEHSASLEITRPLSAQSLDRLFASLTVSGLDSGSSTLVSWVSLLLALWGGVVLCRRDLSVGLWVVGFCLLPIAGWMAALHLFDHWYNVRYTSSGLPAFVVLVAVGMADVGSRAGSWKPSRVAFARPISIAALTSVLVIPSLGAARTEPWNKPPWREVADLLGTLSAGGDVVVARELWSYTCLDYYFRQLGHSVDLVDIDLSEERGREILAESGTAFVVAAGYHRAPWLDSWTASLHPLLSHQVANLRVYYYPDFATLPHRLERGVGVTPILARLGRDTSVEDFSDDAFLLGAGWSVAEREPGGRTFRWAAAERAEFALAAPDFVGPRTLRLLVMPFPSPDLPPQRIRVSVHGQPIGEVDLDPGWQELLVGSYESTAEFDFVTLDFDWLQSPGAIDPNSQDSRRLAVAFDRVEWLPAPAAGTSEVPRP